MFKTISLDKQGVWVKEDMLSISQYDSPTDGGYEISLDNAMS